MVFRWLVCSFGLCCFCINVLRAQEWKAWYDQALEAHSKQQYELSLTAAEKAFAQTSDTKHLAYTVQLITVACLETQQPIRGLEWVEKEIELFHQAEGIDKAYTEALRKEIMLLEMSRNVATALQKAKEYVPVVGKVYGGESPEYYGALLKLGELYAASGDPGNAKSPLAVCVSAFSTLPHFTEEYLTALYLSASADYQLNEFAQAGEKFKLYLDLAGQNGYAGTPEFTLAKKSLSKIIASSSIRDPDAVLSTSDVTPEHKLQYFFKVALGHHQDGRADSAFHYYQVCEQIITENSLSGAPSFSVFLNHAVLLVAERRILQAEDKLSKAKQLAAALYSEKNVFEHCLLLKTEAGLLLAQGQYVDADEKYRLAVRIARDLPEQKHIEIVTDITQTLAASNCFHQAFQIIEPIATNLMIMSAVSEKESADVAVIYSSLIPYTQNKAAIAYLNGHINSYKSIENRAKLQIQLASCLLREADMEGAGRLLAEVIRTQASGTKLHADAAWQLARLRQRQGRYAEAEQYYFLAIRTYDALPGGKSLRAPVYNSLATLYSALGNYQEAERLYLDLMKQEDPNSFFCNTLRQNLASIYEITFRYAEAQRLLEETLKRDQAVLGHFHPDNAITLQNLAVIYLRKGMLGEAESIFSEALEIDKRNSREHTLSYAAKLENLANVYMELNDLEKAQPLLETALKIREEKAGTDHPDYVFNLYGLAVLFQRKKQYDRALQPFSDVSRFYLKQIDELFPALSETEKTAFYNKISEVIAAYQDFAVEYGQLRKDLAGDLYNFRLATKALLLNSSSGLRHRIVNSGNTSLLKKYTEWQHVKEELYRLYTRDTKDGEAPNILALQLKANQLEKDLSAGSELFASEYEKRKFTWHEVQSALRPGEAAVEMIRLKLNQKNDSVVYVALVLKYGTMPPEMILLSDGRKMEKREFNYYRNCMLYHLKDNRSYTTYWQPLTASLSGMHTVFFSPDGIYNKINLLTLFDPSVERYLVDDINIRMVSNTREVVKKQPGANGPRDAVLVGFPDYSLEGNKVVAATTAGLSVERTRNFNYDELGDGIPELPGTKEELLKINELLQQSQWQVKMYLREKASEENVKAVQSPSLLHIATHGFFMEAAASESSARFVSDSLMRANNPLLRSGLILAGAEKYFKSQRSGLKHALGTDDQILTALEVMNLNLDKTELVVLSACETGSGEIRNGEGVFGLQRSFLVSGASSVMMSLWKVNDQATQELMVMFYDQWLKTKDKAEALRKTQLELKKRYAAPYYWGSFVMMGI